MHSLTHSLARPITTTPHRDLPHLKGADIHRVEPGQRGVEPDVGQGQLGASEVALAGEDLLHPVQRSKHLADGPVIGLLLRGEASSVHSVVDVPAGQRLDRLIRKAGICMKCINTRGKMHYFLLKENSIYALLM